MFNYINTDGEPKFFKIGAHAVAVLFVITLCFASFGTVSAGEIGIKTRFNAVVGSIPQGFYVKTPFIENVVRMDVQTQKEDVSGVEAASSDLQVVRSNVAVNFHLNPETAPTIFQNVGVDYAARIIDPAIQESVKATTAKYTAEELITKREEVREGIIALLSEKMKVFGINVDALNITNFDFSKTFNDAIEAKVTAEQNALAAKNKLDQVKYEAQQTIESAKAQAESIRIQAQAINAQGGADYVQLQAIKAWDGKLPSQMIPGGTVPFLNLKN